MPKTSQVLNKTSQLGDTSEQDNVSIYYSRANNRYDKQREKYKIMVNQIKTDMSLRSVSLKTQKSESLKESERKNVTNPEISKQTEGVEKKAKVSFNGNKKATTSLKEKLSSKIYYFITFRIWKWE